MRTTTSAKMLTPVHLCQLISLSLNGENAMSSSSVPAAKAPTIISAIAQCKAIATRE